MIINQTKPVLLIQSHLKGKHTLSAQLALPSFGANRKLESTRKNHACTHQLSSQLRKCCESNIFHSSALTTNSNRSNLNYLFSLKIFCPCRDLNLGPPRYQVDMLPTELSWLGLNYRNIVEQANICDLNTRDVHYSDHNLTFCHFSLKNNFENYVSVQEKVSLN